MAIPGAQLKTWAHQGAVDASKRTHEAIRAALMAPAWPPQYSYDVYLQGSYRNSTNIRGDSDVDIVAELHSSFEADLSALDLGQQTAFHNTYSDASYGWPEFRQHVVDALTDAFDAEQIFEGTKAITVYGSSGLLDADILACQEHRLYAQFISLGSERYVEGVRFQDGITKRWIHNFPKHHYDNGTDKNDESRTKHWYKPTVRMFKNARTHLIKNDNITPDLAPSYFLECLLFNVPDHRYGGDYEMSFEDCLRWLADSNLIHFVCQNGVVPLFGSTEEQWDQAKARKLIEELMFLWDSWY